MSKKILILIISALACLILSSCEKKGSNLSDGWQHNAPEAVTEERSTVVIRDDLPEKKENLVDFNVENAVSLGMFELTDDEMVSVFYQDEYLIVFNDYGEKISELPFGELPEPDEDGEAGTKFTDMNFDGFRDIGVLSSSDKAGDHYRCYLYDSENECFSLNEDLSALSSPVFSAKKKTVTASVNAPQEKASVVYRWEDGKLSEIDNTTEP